jgi:hypothetical protein
MPFDLVTDQGRSTGVPSVRARRAVAIWLFTICVMLLVMIGLGGATRLTNGSRSAASCRRFRWQSGNACSKST